MVQVHIPHRLILLFSFTSVEILSLLFTNDSLVFVRLQTIYDEISHIRCLRGSKVAFALHLGLSVPSVLNWKTGEVIRLHSVPNVDVSLNGVV